MLIRLRGLEPVAIEVASPPDAAARKPTVEATAVK
jgi:hypothetical protein